MQAKFWSIVGSFGLGSLLAASLPAQEGTDQDQQIENPHHSVSIEISEADRGASAYVLTIEPAVGDDPAPTDTHVVAGDFSSDSASAITVSASSRE